MQSSLNASSGQSDPFSQQASEILESITDGFYALDADWRIIYVNQRAMDWWQRSANNLIGAVLWDIFPGNEKTDGYRAHQKAMRERAPVHYEAFSPNLKIWVDANIYPSKSGGLSVYFRDMSERKSTEEALLKSKADLRLQTRLIKLSYEPIMIWDMDHGIQNWNDGCEQLYGYYRDEVIGRVTHDLLRTQHPDGLAVYLEQLQAGRHWEGELRHRTKDGKEVIVESRQELLEMDGHRLVLEANHDVTERKRMAEELAVSERKYREIIEYRSHRHL